MRQDKAKLWYACKRLVNTRFCCSSFFQFRLPTKASILIESWRTSKSRRTCSLQLARMHKMAAGNRLHASVNYAFFSAVPSLGQAVISKKAWERADLLINSFLMSLVLTSLIPMEWDASFQIDEAVYDHFPPESKLCDTEVEGQLFSFQKIMSLRKLCSSSI